MLPFELLGFLPVPRHYTRCWQTIYHGCNVCLSLCGMQGIWKLGPHSRGSCSAPINCFLAVRDADGQDKNQYCVYCSQCHAHIECKDVSILRIYRETHIVHTTTLAKRKHYKYPGGTSIYSTDCSLLSLQNLSSPCWVKSLTFHLLY